MHVEAPGGPAYPECLTLDLARFRPQLAALVKGVHHWVALFISKVRSDALAIASPARGVPSAMADRVLHAGECHCIICVLVAAPPLS